MLQECYAGTHLVVALAIGIPGRAPAAVSASPHLNFAIMWMHRRELAEPHVAATYGFLYHQYGERFWFWSSVEQLRLLVLVAVTVFGRRAHHLVCCTPGP